jgi:hypothetical protein
MKTTELAFAAAVPRAKSALARGLEAVAQIATYASIYRIP